MDNSKINLHVIDGDNIVRIAELPAQAEGAPVRVKSLKNGKFLLVRGTNEPAPDHIVVKRDGDDLMIFTQEGDDKADIIIEDFYLQQGELYGMAQEGSYHLYESSDSDNEAFLLLEEGGSDALHLSEGGRLALPEVTSSELSHGMMAAGAVAAVGLLTGIVAALNAGSSGKTAPTPAVPSEIQATDHVGIIVGAMASGVSTDDARPVLDGNGTPGSLIQVYDNGSLVGSTMVNPEGKWRWQPENALPEGEHDLQFAALARGRQSAKSPALNFTVDLTPPDKPVNISITDGNDKDLSSGGVTNANPLHLSGKGEPGDTVLLYDGDTLVGTTVVDAGGHWRADITLPSEGDHDLRAGFRDPAGNAGAKSEPVTIDYDVTPPDAPAAIEIADGNDKDLSSGGVTNANPLHLSGKGEPGDTVLLYDGDTLVGTTVVDAGGHWRADITLPSEGDHDLRVGFRDPAGNAGAKSDPVTIDYDVTPPDAPGAIEIADGNDKDLSFGGVTNANPLHLSGKGDPGDTVLLYDGDTLVGTTVVDAGGHWRADITLPSEGDHDLRAGFRDPAGNAGAKSDPVTVDYDVTPPDAPAAIEIADGNDKDLSSGGVTNANPLHLSGKGDPEDTVLLYDGDTLVGTTVVDAGGHWRADITLPSEGDHDLRAGFRDPAGNAGAKSEPVTVNYDITSPDAPVPEVLENSVGKDLILQGLSNDGHVNMAGKNGDAGDIVKLYDGNTLIGSSTVRADGSWSVAGELIGGDGNHNLKASFTDPAGNESEKSTPLTVDLDTVAEAPLFTLTDNTPTLTGSAGSVEPGALVTIYNGTTPVASFSANADGSWTWRPTPTLSDGNYQFSAKQTDRAGNISAASEWLGFRVATTVDDFNDTTGQGWTFASAWDGVGFFDGQQVQLSGGRNAGHSTAGDIMSRTMHVEAGHTYNVSVRSLVWATTGIIIDNPSHFLTITVDGVKVLDNVQVINGVYGGSWTASTTGNVVITLSDSTDTNGVGSWIVLDNFTVRDQGVTASNLFSDNALTNEPFSLVEHVLALTDNIASLDLSRAADLYQTTAQEVHAISLKGHGQNLLNIGIDDVLALGHENQFLNNGNKQLMVKGDEGDRVTLDTIAGEHGIAHWNAQADVMVEGEVYHVYQNGNHDVEVFIQQGIQIQIQ
ncbi:TPA: Ig-like domain-containing protein [Enterobacter ludwigii]|uniref:Ig-like domain-containing protein n=1 Tax=Enterobacter ludwigii TaxID=299767 RepID=UPI00242CA00F|nr:Ig-like domain-containing protein [Enterobacter ludwigii]WFY27868.1 Ig-like domain-containing protein [Enterobacter ludwigii]